MATPKCPKCDWTRFQMTQSEPTDSKYKVMLIHCAKCGCVVGTEPYFNTAVLLEKLGKKLGVDIYR